MLTMIISLIFREDIKLILKNILQSRLSCNTAAAVFPFLISVTFSQSISRYFPLSSLDIQLDIRFDF